MSRIRCILLVCLLACGMTAGAQTYQQVVRRNFWNDSQNITGVRQDSLSRSYAELTGEYEGGEFRDSWQALRGWSAGAATASIRHFDRLTLKGAFSFSQVEGYDMCGSMFIRPGYYPVDVLEFTPGRKTLQTYAFDGGISYNLTKAWRIGAKMDFESSNIAKRKDLRHSNWLLDMTVAPGFMYQDGKFAFGANYIYRKTTETVEATQVGVSESSYYAFLDKGLMYGVYNIWTGSGLHLDEAGVKGFPVKEISNGAALQLQYGNFFAEAQYVHSSGSIGEKEYVWFLFPGNSASLRLGYKHKGQESQHYARLGLSWNGRRMDETILEKVTEGGISTVVNHGANRILSQSGWSIRPEYEYVAERLEVLAKAEAGVQEDLVSQMYPYLDWQSLLTFNADLRVKYYLGQFVLIGQVGFGAGKVSADSWLADSQTVVQTAPQRLQNYYDWKTEYATAPRVSAGLGLRWNFWRGIYAQIEGHVTRGFDHIYIIGNSRAGAGITIGYDF